ncbi:unnamed protein product [Polarella glacialis]|uniref:Cathepsin propeptide inhibitor domain-containing protein n=1 Tax=Polarella glacialis TaxID=89957 RepID=A0A813ELC9_POLGL|nr:unnamed protein product [Polarella glacialis]
MQTFISTASMLFALLLAAHAEDEIDESHLSVVSAYEAFQAKFGRSEIRGSQSYEARLKIFAKRQAEVEAQNTRGGSWRAEVNEFADYTEDEFAGMLGYRRLGGWSTSQSSHPSPRKLQSARLIAESIDYRKLNSSSWVIRQGGCGACWAIAAIGAMETHAELCDKREPRRLSMHELIDCVPNPKNCGGPGGCVGSVFDLAFQYVQDLGLSYDE